jgi:hypothetical protein
MLRDGQQVRVNLAGMRVGSVVFHAVVTDAVGTIVRQVSENPPTYLVRLLFSFVWLDREFCLRCGSRCDGHLLAGRNEEAYAHGRKDLPKIDL